MCCLDVQSLLPPFLLFLHCGAVFTEERHCRDKYDQNCEGTKVAEGCFLIFGDKGD